jgi:hypothetical protein
MHRTLLVVFFLLLACIGCAVLFFVYALSRVEKPERVSYGVSFSPVYAEYLGLSWEETYRALFTDLGVKKVRIAAQWDAIEKEKGVYDFSVLDAEVRIAKENGATLVLALGRRTPRWPECHVPQYAQGLSWEEQKDRIRAFLETVVFRYKDNEVVHLWQVENEPFLTVFASDYCGASLDTAFLEEEIALVKKLDPSRKVLLTDSGNLGLWWGAYARGDVFGTSVYVYLSNKTTGPLRTILPPEWYVVKRTLMETFLGKKESILIELSLEPWTEDPITTRSFEEQKKSMDETRFDEVVTYGKETRFTEQYLWGVEWWYLLKTKGNDASLWEKAKSVFSE